MKINTYRSLLEMADLSSIYSRTKPLIINEDNFDKTNHKFFDDIKVKINDDFENMKICSDNRVYFLIEPSTTIEFEQNGNLARFQPGDMILISSGVSLSSKNWSFEKVDDLINFDKDFERVNYNEYEIEKNSIDDLKKFKCELVKYDLEEKYKKNLLELKEKSSISFNLKFSRNS